MFDLIMNNKKKLIVSLISIMILFLGLTFLVRKGNTNLTEHQKRLKLYDQVQQGDDAIDGTNYVTFDAYFLEDLDNNGIADGIRGNTLKVDDSKKLYLKLEVLGDVTLNDGIITFEKTNVRLSGNLGKSSVVKNNISSTNISNIALSDSIGNGTTALINVTVNSNLTNDLNSFSGINKVKLTGTVHNNITGEDTAIEKVVAYEVDWYETDITATIGSDYKTEYVSITDDSTANAKVKYNFNTYASTKTLLKGAYITGTIPKLNGYEPVNVTISGTNVTSTYDPTTLSFSAKREAVLDDTLITSQAYTYKKNGIAYNEWQVEIEYPAEASYDNAALAMPVKAWYEGYNNLKPTYTNPITSNIAEKALVAKYVPDVSGDGDPTVFATQISLGSYSSALAKNYINKTAAIKLFSDEDAEKKTTYNEYLSLKLLSHNKYDVTNNVIINVLDQRFNASENITSVTNYKTMSISSAETYLGASGYIKLYNAETDELIHIFTALDWNSPYTFDTTVRKIRIETSEISHKAYDDWKYVNRNTTGGRNLYIDILNISFTKEIDNEALVNKYDIATFNSFDYVEGRTKTNLMITKNGSTTPSLYQENTTQYGTAVYTTYISSKISGQITDGTNEITSIDSNKEKEVSIKLTTGPYGDIVQGWINGEFIVALPEEILDIDIDNITISNPNVKVEGYEKVDINGHKCIRILTSNTEQASYTITINGTIIPDARTDSKTTKIELYGYNGPIGLSDSNAKDKYDVNSNLDFEEKVNYSSISLQIQAPNELITTTTYIDRNSKITVSPLIAEVNPIDDSNVGTVEIGLTNSSQYSVENIVLIGKLGFVGNTYQVTSTNQSIDLGSEFDVKMVSDGITYPSSIDGIATMLDGKVTIYYSEEETPTADINNVANNWKTKEQVSDFNNIKTYMIVINDYVLDPGKQAKFTYDVELPLNTSNLNKVTYFNHGVYYDAILEEGNHALVTGGSKLGIRVSRQYNLELKDTKFAGTRTIDKTKYVITAKDSSDEIIDQKILTTNENGIASTKGLYVGQKYELKQTSVKEPYILDEEIKTFEIKNGNNDVLELENTGTYKSINLANDQKLNIELENETTYDLVLTNKDLDTDAAIGYSRFKITGKGYESGQLVVADVDGKIHLDGLYLDESYEVEQIRVDNYLLTEKFTFRIARDSNGEVKITKAREPQVNDLVDSNNYYEKKSDSDGSYYKIKSSSRRWNDAYIPIDMTNLEGTYKLVVPYKYYSSYNNNKVYLYLSDSSTNLNNDFLSLSNDTSNSSLLKSAETTQYYDSSSYQMKNIVGGKVYYLYISAYNYSSLNSYLKIYEPVMQLTNGEKCEYFIVDENSNVATYENSDALQTIHDSDNQDEPVLTVNVKNKAIPTYTLEITKKDAGTGQPLAGAQYKISGAGLSEAGKYITTDENGKASIKLYHKYIANEYDNNHLINGINYNPYDYVSKLQEVSAPVGYTLDDNEVEFINQYKFTPSSNQTINGVYNYIVDDFDNGTNTVTYSNFLNRFKEAEWDNDTKTLRVTLYDYPIVKITKTDAETGELLPNTLFTIYKVERVNGSEILTPAVNSKGDIIGTETPIGNTTYYVVATDENGNISLDLGKGKYRLQEVQAADEKYEVSDVIYYFGIGETIPHTSAGFEIVGGFDMRSFYVGDDNASSEIFATSDGGWIASNRLDYSHGELVKYDKDGNVEWVSDANNEYQYYVTEHIYPNEPERNKVVKEPLTYYNYGNIRHIVEANDGSGYYVSTNNHNLVTKYDNDGNKIWYSSEYDELHSNSYERVCTIDGNTDANGNVKYYSWSDYYNDWQDYDSYTELTDDIRIDNDTYYCGVKNEYYNYLSAYSNYIAPAPNGGVYLLTNVYSNSKFRLSDGTSFSFNNDNTIYVLLEYDKDGNFVNIYNISELIQQGLNEYVQRYNLTSPGGYYLSASDLYHAYMGYYDNGDLLIAPYTCPYVIKLRYNAQENKFDIVYFNPPGFNGNGWAGSYYSNYDGILDMTTLPNGGFTLISNSDRSYKNTANDPFYSTEMQQFDNHPLYIDYDGEWDYTGSGNTIPIQIYNGEGKYDNIIIPFASFTKYDYVFDQNIAKNNYLYYYANNGTGKSFQYLPDGGVVVGLPVNLGTLPDGPVARYRTVELATGEEIRIDNEATYLIYKVNGNSEIEWLRQFKGLGPVGHSNSKSRLSTDGKTLLMPVAVGDGAKEIGSDTEILDIINETAGRKFLLLKLVDEVQASGPEAYTLDIENNRKEYRITATSNAGGEITVINPDNGQTVITSDGSAATILEKVKYGDDNKYNITIKPNDGFGVSSVLINNKPATYQANDDGSIILDKIENITENKDIQITYSPAQSKVIVKHYIKGTTTRITNDGETVSDDIILGQIGAPYKAETKENGLYSIARDANGEPVLPTNMEGNIDTEPITVIFYYQENEVELRTNYYVDGTEEELAPTNIEYAVKGTAYQSDPLDIEFYEFTRTIGDPTGTLDNSVTEVTHMYRQNNEVTITIRHVDKATGKNLVDPITKTVTRHDTYTTDDPVTIPAKYRLISTPDNATGPAEDANIEVIYYYEVIPFNVSVDKKINSVLLNGEKQTFTNGKNVSISPKKTDNVIVYYSIDVKNTGDIKAKFKVVEEEIPGFDVYEKGAFTKVGDNYELNVELNPGEEKTYEISYKWNQKDYGISTNKVELKEVTNDKGFDEPDALDNTSTATIETKIPKEVLDTPIVDTIDKIGTSIILFITSMVGIIISIVLIKKKNS